MPDDDTMTTSEVADALGMKNGDAANTWLSRRGINPVGRQPGRHGQNLYRRADVLNAKGPGRGYRSDLHGPRDDAPESCG